MKVLSTHLSTLLVIFAASAQQTQVIGHRGAMGHAPENTILSVQKALALGVDGIEVDVFRCLSGEIVVFHDKKLDKLTNGSGKIEEKTLKQLNALKVMGSEPIPTLENIIDVIDGSVQLNIELNRFFFGHFTSSFRRQVRMFKLTPCCVRNTSSLLTEIRSISSIWIKLVRTTSVFHRRGKPGQGECSQVIKHNLLKKHEQYFSSFRPV